MTDFIMHFPQFLKLAAGYLPGSKYEVGSTFFLPHFKAHSGKIEYQNGNLQNIIFILMFELEL